MLLLLFFVYLNAAFGKSNCENLIAKFAYKTKGLTVSFENRSVGDVEQVIWTFDDGSVVSEPNPAYTFKSPGEHHFTLTVLNSNGCSNTFAGKVYLFP